MNDTLVDLRREALAAYESLPYPTGREEHWRFTDVKSLQPSKFQPGSFTTAGDAMYAKEFDDRLGTLVKPDDPWRALNLANPDGIFMHVPKGVRVDAPIERTFTTEGGLVTPRTLIVVEEGAEVVFNDIWRGTGDSLVLPVVEIFVGANARVGWATWQDCGPGVKYMANIKARLERGAFMQSVVATTGGDFSRTSLEVELAGEHAESEMLGVYFPRGEQRFEHWTLQEHAAPHTKSDLLYKGAIDDHSRSIYYGTIKVRENAAHTDAYQANRNLALSTTARADSMPQLEIDTNEVRCTHGATIGRIDEDQLFYLQSRGLPRLDATRLVTYGFLNEVVERVEWSGLHERLAAEIHARVDA